MGDSGFVGWSRCPFHYSIYKDVKEKIKNFDELCAVDSGRMILIELSPHLLQNYLY
jgi:hypothetical protein